LVETTLDVDADVYDGQLWDVLGRLSVDSIDVIPKFNSFAVTEFIKGICFEARNFQSEIVGFSNNRPRVEDEFTG
jgi:hypothetical protein